MTSDVTVQPIIRTGPAITSGMKAEEYVAAVHKMHEHEKPQGFVNGGLLNFSRWVGDAALAVIPKNRFSCAVGLTSGGALGLYLAKLMSGMELATYTPVQKTKFPKFLQPLFGILKFDPLSASLGNRWKKLGAFYTFTAMSFAGVMIGAWAAYRGFYKRNEAPNSLEDYTARVAQHQGSKWRWLAASSSVFGSVSGYYTLPFAPGINYGSSIAFYTVLNQDRKIMTPGLRVATGTTTTSYLGLREGIDYICKYAIHNTAKTPAELEYLTLTIMGPLAHAAGITLTADHIQKFVSQIHTVRDKYWREGGIPENMKKVAMKDLEEHFKGEGLDKAFYESGFDTTKINFTKLNGLIGKVGNRLGAMSKIEKEQQAYRAMVTEWRKDWMNPDGSEPAQAMGVEPVVAKLFTNDVKKSPALTAALNRPATHQERAASATETATTQRV